ncbi:hypothetical protein, partial, partial [Absidia glauca]
MSMSEDVPMNPSHYHVLAEQIQALQEQMGHVYNIERASTKEPHVSLPDPFDGDRRYAQNFILKLELVFSAQPSRYNTPGKQVALAASLLRKSAFSWFSPFLKTNDPAILTNFANFKKRFLDQFGDRDVVNQNERRLTTIKQAGRSVSAYASEIQRLSAELDWNDSALRSIFYNGLDDIIKDELCRMETPDTLLDLVNLTIRIDNRFHDRRMERKNKYRGPQPSTYNRGQYSRNYSGPTPMDLDMTTEDEPTDDPEENMDIALSDEKPRYGKLTNEERERRMKNRLCLYCGKPGHVVNQCLRKPNSPPRRPQHISHTAPDLHLRQEHFTLRVTIAFDQSSITVPALIDTGAHSCFMSEALVKQNNIPCKKKPEPIPIHTIDGSPLSGDGITHETMPIELIIDGHKETATFNILSRSTYPIILGAPWYKKHDPVTINWNAKRITFKASPQNEEQPQPEYIVAAFTTTDQIIQEPTTPTLANQTTQDWEDTITETVEKLKALSIDQISDETITNPDSNPDSQHESETEPCETKVPEKYKNFAPVFNKISADILPCHRKYDMEITLKK